LPSAFNAGHVRFFLIDRDESPDTIGLVPLLGRVLEDGDLIHAKKCDSLVQVGDKVEPEFSIEVVIRKIMPKDLINYRWHEPKS
jgi:hypothetical protein